MTPTPQKKEHQPDCELRQGPMVKTITGYRDTHCTCTPTPSGSLSSNARQLLEYVVQMADLLGPTSQIAEEARLRRAEWQAWANSVAAMEQELVHWQNNASAWEADVAEAEANLLTERSKVAAMEQQYAILDCVVAAIGTVVSGGEVSDFEASYAEVRGVLDLQAALLTERSQHQETKLALITSKGEIERLRGYAQHKPDCPQSGNCTRCCGDHRFGADHLWAGSDEDPCSCGLAALLTSEATCPTCGFTQAANAPHGPCVAPEILNVRAAEAALLLCQQERDELLLDRHQPGRVSPCGHYRVFAMPLLHEDGTESPYCMQCDRDELQVRKDAAYEERNRLVAVLSKLWPSHLAHHPEDDLTWGRDWMTIVCIHSPAGQLTWHIHDSQRHLFAHLSDGENHWDGDTTPEKYERLAAISAEALLSASRLELEQANKSADAWEASYKEMRGNYNKAFDRAGTAELQLSAFRQTLEQIVQEMRHNPNGPIGSFKTVEKWASQLSALTGSGETRKAEP